MSLDQNIISTLFFFIVILLILGISCIQKIYNLHKKWNKDKEEVNLILNKMIKEYDSKNQTIVITLKHVQKLLKGGEVDDFIRFEQKINNL
jgi:pyruvate dehydrogenase complex dehydrogenase (E1) component